MPISGSSGSLAGDSDVVIAASAQGDVLIYQTADGKWHNIAADVAYIAPTFIVANSWGNVGGGNQVAGFMKDAFGFVHLRGEITGGALGTAAFTLPAGYRPTATCHLPGNTFNGSDTIIAGGWTYVDSSGAVAPQGSSGPRFSLDGVIFLAGN